MPYFFLEEADGVYNKESTYTFICRQIKAWLSTNSPSDIPNVLKYDFFGTNYYMYLVKQKFLYFTF